MRKLLHIAVTLFFALCAAQLCQWMHTPIPWMLGPLLVTAAGSLAGLPTRSANSLRNGGQWIIGATLGLYFTPEVGALELSLWWAIGVGIVWTVAMGFLFGAWLHRQHASLLT